MRGDRRTQLTLRRMIHKMVKCINIVLCCVVCISHHTFAYKHSRTEHMQVTWTGLDWSTTGNTIYNCVVRKMSPHKTFSFVQQIVQRVHLLILASFSFVSHHIMEQKEKKLFTCTKKRTFQKSSKVKRKKNGYVVIWLNLLGTVLWSWP